MVLAINNFTVIYDSTIDGCSVLKWKTFFCCFSPFVGQFESVVCSMYICTYIRLKRKMEFNFFQTTKVKQRGS